MHLFNLRAGQAIEETLLQMLFAFSFSIWAVAVTWKGTWLIPLLAHVLVNGTAGEITVPVWASFLVSAYLLADGWLVMSHLESVPMK